MNWFYVLKSPMITTFFVFMFYDMVFILRGYFGICRDQPAIGGVFGLHIVPIIIFDGLLCISMNTDSKCVAYKRKCQVYV